MASKYIGETLEGRWRVVLRYRKNKSYYFLLVNIYNKNEMELRAKTISDIFLGRTTLSSVRYIRTKYNKKRGLH